MKQSATIFSMVGLLVCLEWGACALQAQTVDSPAGIKFETVRSAKPARMDVAKRPVSVQQKRFLTKEQQKAMRRAGAASSSVSAENGKKAVAANAKAEAVEPPFFCGFDYARELEEKWMVVDGDKDGDAWEYGTADDYVTFDGGDESGFAMASYVLVEAPEDYLITRAPVRMAAGTAYVAFHHASVGGSYKERLRVYYSSSDEADVSKMTLIGEIEDSVAGWKFVVLPFELEEAGDYHFCFLHCSEPDQGNLYLDNIEIGEGVFVGTPDLVVNRVLLPLSSCGLGDSEQVGVIVKNTGTAAVTKMRLSYKVDEAEVVEVYEDRIEPAATEVLYFEKTVDLSGEGRTYVVEAKAVVEECDGKTEENTDNNAGKGRVTHFTPVTALPFEAAIEENSDMLGYDPAVWLYSDYEGGVLSCAEPEPVVTRCMPLEAGETYRFTYAYLAGIYLWIIEITDDFDVVCGRAGTPVSEWAVLQSHTGVYTQDVLVDGEVLYECAASGNYSFGIVPKAGAAGYNGTLIVGRMKVEQVAAHDVKMAMLVPSIGVRTPVRHAKAPYFDIVVANRGANDESDVKVTMKQMDKVLKESSGSAVKRGESAYYSMDVMLENLKANEEVALTFEVGMAVQDDNPADNQRMWTFVATDGLYAFDDVTLTDYEDGLGTKEFIFGQIFPLMADDTLAAVEFGWFDLSAYINQTFTVGVEVYPLDEFDKAGECLLSYEFTRRLSGVQRVEVPACPLRKGRYFIAVKQLSDMNIAMGYDENPEGLFYAMTPGRNARVSPVPSYGHVALRAVMGGGGLGNETRADLSAFVKSYPNPVSGQWTVVARDLEINRVEICDMTGGVVFRSADRMATDTYGVDMTNFTPGLYMARVHTDAGVQVIKIAVR